MLGCVAIVGVTTKTPLLPALTPIPPADLVRASKHVFYEVRMLVDTAEALSFTLCEPVIKNALLESFGIHARALLDFLALPAPQKGKDDVLARHYVPQKWAPPALPPELDKVKDDVNKHFAHITLTRLAYELPPVQKTWSVLPIARALRALLETEFYTKVDRSLLDAVWGDGVPQVRPDSPIVMYSQTSTGMVQPASQPAHVLIFPSKKDDEPKA